MHIEKEVRFSEFTNFVCCHTEWTVWDDNGSPIIIHTKRRFIPTDGRSRHTSYSTFDCKSGELTALIRRNDVED